eukprot:scaffold7821_cov107-Amphora_coffeaeformis.AAC.3
MIRLVDMFALCDAETGYVFDFLPNGRMEKRTIHDIVLCLVMMIPTSPLHNYVVGMDNYFTWAKVVTSLTEMGVGCVGMARYARGWPPKEMKEITDGRYNTLYTMVDKGKFLIARWIDINVVTMVFNVHISQEQIDQNCKRPRLTNTNQEHIQTIWGNTAVRKVAIPCIIDDYNHWMLGVDKADQLIAYYRQNLRCRRTWLPFLFYALDVARIISYIACYKLGWNFNSRRGSSIHKDFLVEFVKALLARATTFETRCTRRCGQAIFNMPLPPQKRKRISTKNPSLPDYRLLRDYGDHIQVDLPRQGIEEWNVATFGVFSAKTTFPSTTPLECHRNVKDRRKSSFVSI